MSNELLSKAITFINYEADLLDQGEFHSWLDLWQQDGVYIVPIDLQTNDFLNTLNYAYDDKKMREKRVHRLYSGESISTTPRARTVRLTGRHRLVKVDGEHLEVRCAQSLWEFRKGNKKNYIADITYKLIQKNEEFTLQEKIIRVINADDYLYSIGYIL